jgi:hypothetical protein
MERIPTERIIVLFVLLAFKAGFYRSLGAGASAEQAPAPTKKPAGNLVARW